MFYQIVGSYTKDWAYVVNLDEYKSTETDWRHTLIALELKPFQKKSIDNKDVCNVQCVIVKNQDLSKSKK